VCARLRITALSDNRFVKLAETPQHAAGMGSLGGYRPPASPGSVQLASTAGGCRRGWADCIAGFAEGAFPRLLRRFGPQRGAFCSLGRPLTVTIAKAVVRWIRQYSAGSIKGHGPARVL